MAKSVFVIDDSAATLLGVSGILDKAGYRVSTAGSAEAALQQLEAGLQPDLMITDLTLPGMNGIELIRQVRQLQACRFMPIIFLSAHAQPEHKHEARAAGASGWLVKPATAEQLLQTIALVLK